MKATKAAVDPVAGASLDITSDDLYLMAAGTWYRSYDKMGAHPTCENGVSGYRFAVWAPGVRSVHVVGDFNGWDTLANPLSPLPTGGVWCGFVRRHPRFRDAQARAQSQSAHPP